MNVDSHAYITMRLRGSTPAAPDNTRDLPDDWRLDAICSQIALDAFFPEVKGASVAYAKSICALCPVIEACLETHLGEQHGVFGGTSPRDRERIRRDRKTAA